MCFCGEREDGFVDEVGVRPGVGVNGVALESSDFIILVTIEGLNLGVGGQIVEYEYAVISENSVGRVCYGFIDHHCDRQAPGSNTKVRVDGGVPIDGSVFVFVGVHMGGLGDYFINARLGGDLFAPVEGVGEGHLAVPALLVSLVGDGGAEMGYECASCNASGCICPMALECVRVLDMNLGPCKGVVRNVVCGFKDLTQRPGPRSGVVRDLGGWNMAWWGGNGRLQLRPRSSCVVYCQYKLHIWGNEPCGLKSHSLWCNEHAHVR